jgi:Ca2+-binding RTX toxin-like protein
VNGRRGNDTLVGGGAADRLDGGYGNDILVGRGGKDKFVFSTDATNHPNVDTIRDFTVNVDKIIIDTEVFQLGLPGVLAAALFHIGAHAADASNRIIYNPNTGALFYDHDGRGGDVQVKMAQLGAHLALDYADFVVIG